MDVALYQIHFILLFLLNLNLMVSCFSITVSTEDTCDALPSDGPLSDLHHLAADWLEL